MLEQLWRGGGFEGGKKVANQRERRAAVEETNVFQFVGFSVWDTQAMGEGKFALAIDQVRSQFGNLAVEFDHLWAIVGRQFKPEGMAPAREPMKQFQIR